MDPELVRRLGDPPQGRGVLGVVAEADRPVRLSRIADHPRSVGFPPGHPEMKTFIGAPLRFGDRTLGFLYLTEKRDGAEFTRDDEDTVERFAAQAGAAIANARLMREVRRLGSVAERERIGRELHDGTLQELYALSLHLQAALLDETGDPSVARQAISRALKRINQVMADIRRYVFGAGAETSLRVNLLDHIKEAVAALEDSGQAEVAWTWHLPANLTVPEPTAHDLAQVVREAVSNAVRHGKARHIVIAARRQGGRLHLAVRDDGQGFRQTRSTRRAGHGLANMARRAEALGGRVTVRSSPGAGTRIGLSVPEPWGHEG
jgi:signal transduction histidine kinase